MSRSHTGIAVALVVVASVTLAVREAVLAQSGAEVAGTLVPLHEAGLMILLGAGLVALASSVRRREGGRGRAASWEKS